MVLKLMDVHFFHCINNKSLGHHYSFKVNIPHVPPLFIHFFFYQASVMGHKENGKCFPFCESKGCGVTLLFTVAHY